jgi:uncharacterized protein YodC (DUF2158 family)
MPEFKKGDVVRLKSGGPKMTVCSDPHETLGNKRELSLACTWFNQEEQLKTASLFEYLLEQVVD